VRYRVNYTLRLEYLIILRGKSQNPLIPKIMVQTINNWLLTQIQVRVLHGINKKSLKNEALFEKNFFIMKK